MLLEKLRLILFDIYVKKSNNYFLSITGFYIHHLFSIFERIYKITAIKLMIIFTTVGDVPKTP